MSESFYGNVLNKPGGIQTLTIDGYEFNENDEATSTQKDITGNMFLTSTQPTIEIYLGDCSPETGNNVLIEHGKTEFIDSEGLEPNDLGYSKIVLDYQELNPGNKHLIKALTRIQGDDDYCGHIETVYNTQFTLPLVGDIGQNHGEIFNHYNVNKAEGEYSHAEGFSTQALGDYGSHAEGHTTKATGYGSHAEGALTEASGNYSHAEGQENTAKGFYSHAGGFGSKAQGTGDFVHGCYLVSSAAGGYKAIFGSYNELDINGEKKFQLGAGNGEDNRKDLFYITNNGAYCPDFIINNNGNEIKLSNTNVTISKSEDGRIYTVKQGENEIGNIEVALNAMVNKAEIVEQDKEGNTGTFIKLTVNTENNEQETLYINVSQIAFNPMIKDSNTIDMAIGQDKLLSAEIKSNSIEEKHIANNSITINKINNGAINNDKIIDNTISNSKLVNKTIGADKIHSSAFKDLAKDYNILMDLGFFHMNPVDGYGLILNTNGRGGNIGSASLGYWNEVYCETSVALGVKNTIKEEPENCFCSGVIAAGRLNTAVGNGVAALGLNNRVEYISQDSDGGSIGLGAYNEISQIEKTEDWQAYQNLTGALALGSHNLIKNDEGDSLQGAIALGYKNESKASGAIAAGLGTIATNPGSFVGGKYNLQDNNKEYIAIIGNGQETQRSNAFTLSQNGNGWFAGEIETDRIILRSSTPNSNKKFALSIDDNGILSIQEV